MHPHHLVARLMQMSESDLERATFLWSGGAMTFGELRQRMLRLAAWLRRSAGVVSGDRVAICLPKSPEAAIALYGIMAAGGIYAPLHYQGPIDRLNATLASLKPRALLTTAQMAPQFTAENSVGLQIVEPQPDGGGLEPLLARTTPLAEPVEVGSEDLAWLIFTSGSTGEPKGVMLTHRAMTANVEAMQRRDLMRPADLRISHAPMHYISAFDLLFPLVSGARLYLLPEKEAMFPERLAEVMEGERTTIMSSSATALRLLLERGDLEKRDLSQLRRISFYGEPMPMAALRKLMAVLPHVEFVNHYGATELDMIANFTVPRPLPEDMLRLPLGEPADYVQLSLRDPSGQEVPEGEIGEICLVSPGVTIGYWGDPELSAAKRMPGIADSFRTGDLAYRASDGLLYPAGRMDQMAKIRGHRLDLGEVEAVLRLHPLVRDALAVVDGEPDLEVKAVILSEGSPDLLGELNQICIRRLPRFGRPVRITVLNRFPQLSTGKIDRPALRRIAVE